MKQYNIEYRGKAV